MKKVYLGLLIGLVTMAGFAQWSNPGDDVPAYHAKAPDKGVELPAILSGSQLTGSHFEFEWPVAI